MADIYGDSNFLAGDQYPGGGSDTPYTLTSGGTQKVQPVPTYQQPVSGGTSSTQPYPTGGVYSTGQNTGAPSYDTINQLYQQDLGRSATQAEYNNYWNTAGQGADWQSNFVNTIYNSPEAQAYRSKTGSYGGTNIFDDPATQQYEQLINGLVKQFTTPYTAPDYQNAISGLQAYINKLNGPAFTPDELNLFQTQQIDPLMQQRDASRQAIINRFAAQGMGPSSGPVQQALLQNDQQYEALTNQARAGIANSAVATGKQQQANAAGLLQQLPGIETSANTYNLNNALQGASLASQIPQMAWQRITGANNGLQSSNPIGLLQNYMQGQQQGINQGAQYSAQVQQLIPYLLQALPPDVRKALGLG